MTRRSRPLIRPSATFSPAGAGEKGLDFESSASINAHISMTNTGSTFIEAPRPAQRGEGGRRPGEGPSRFTTALRSAVFVLIVATVATARGQTSTTPPQLPGKVGITQKLNAALPLDAIFRDENGRAVRLGDYFHSGRPVLLNFVYYRCPMLCPTVLESLTSSLTEMRGDLGKEYDVLTVSIDPRDMPSAAMERKVKYVKRYGRQSAWDGWHFLTGFDSGIHRLTDAVGFQYAYDPQHDQFAHGTTLLALTPDGHVSRYFNGFEYKPRDLRLGLVEASKGKIGTLTDSVLLLCYHYDPATGKYSRTAMNGVRAGGIATVLGLGAFIFVMIRSERRRAAGPRN
jgi:protein SCO1